jgi:hypothetical protein
MAGSACSAPSIYKTARSSLLPVKQKSIWVPKLHCTSCLHTALDRFSSDGFDNRRGVGEQCLLNGSSCRIRSFQDALAVE